MRCFCVHSVYTVYTDTLGRVCAQLQTASDEGKKQKEQQKQQNKEKRRAEGTIL